MSSIYNLVDVYGSFDKGIRSYTRIWQVFTSDTTLGPGQICSVAPGTLYESWVHGTEVDNWALLKKKSAKQMGSQDGGFLWLVTCEYDSEVLDQGQGGDTPSGSSPADNNNTQPDLRLPSWEFSSNKTTKLFVQDPNTGDPVTNSAGQPFDPPVEVPEYRTTIKVTMFKTIGSDNKANVVAYCGKVNSGAWYGFAPGTVLCTDYQLTSQFEQGGWWWHKSVSFEVNLEGWNPIKILDAGTVYFESMSKPPQPILDKSGNPITSPVPLNGAGMPLMAGQDPVYREYSPYIPVDFSAIL